MTIFFREVIALLPILVLCMTVLCVLLFIILYRNHYITFFITIFGISLSFFSLYLVWKNGLQQVTNLIYIDGFSLLCMMLILIAGFLSSVISRVCLSHYCSYDNRDEFYLLLLIMHVGAMLVVNASHVVTLFFGIELISLPLFGLMYYFNLYKYSLEATIKYVLLSGVSTAFLLFGISLIYAETTYLSFFDIHLELVKSPFLSQSMILIAGVVMMLVGFGFKLSLVPFHLWTGDVYQGVPEIAGMCLATVSKISIFSVFMRFVLLFPESYNKINYVLFLVSCFSILFGNLMAINQNNLKRVLAYSSIAHMGYLLVAVLATMKSSEGDYRYVLNPLTDYGMEAISIGLINYLFATLGIFGIFCLLFCCYYKNNNKWEDIGELFLYRGLFWKDPILTIIFTIIMLSLAGLPLTLGFISKFYLIMVSIKKELLWFVVVIVLGTGISMLYYFRVITTLYLNPLSKHIRYWDVLSQKMNHDVTVFTVANKFHGNQWISRSSGIIIFILSLFLLFFGICPQLLIHLFFLIQKNFVIIS